MRESVAPGPEVEAGPPEPAFGPQPIELLWGRVPTAPDGRLRAVRPVGEQGLRADELVMVRGS